MILRLNKRLHTEVLGETLTHAYYYPFNKVIVYLEFGCDFEDIMDTLLDSKELLELSSWQRRIIKMDLEVCWEQLRSGERLLWYDDIFPVKSITDGDSHS